MPTATVLIQSATPGPGAHKAVTEDVRSVGGVASAAAVIGAYDTVATIVGDTPEDLVTIARTIADLEPVGHTLTLPWIGDTP